MIKIAIAFGVLVTATLLMKKPGMSYRQSILKTMYPAIMWTSKGSGQKQIKSNQHAIQAPVSFYTLTGKDINGNVFSFSTLAGKKVLLANTASNCGFTGQYEALEKLAKQYGDKLVVIGFPSNDFKEQESADNGEIALFCKKNYGVTFLLMEKSSVLKGKAQNEIYKWLSDTAMNGWCDQAPAWNFCKYLVNEQGMLTHYFPMTVDPLAPEVINAIGAN